MDALDAVEALPSRVPLNLFALIVPEEGYTERVLAINTPSVVVDGVKPSVALFAALNTSDLQFV